MSKTIFGLLFTNFVKFLTRRKAYTEKFTNGRFRRPRSVFIRHLDCGSCNGCELELNALESPLYDIQHLGYRIKASPFHADVIVLTGPYTHNMAVAAEQTLEAMPGSGKVITIGDCAADGGIYKDSYALAPKPTCFDRMHVGHVVGCPPTPEAILERLEAIEFR